MRTEIEAVRRGMGGGTGRAVLRAGLGAVLALHLLWGLALDKPIFEVRTNYLHWSSTLPAVSICQLPAPGRKNHLERFLDNLEWPGDSYCHKCANQTNLPQSGFRRIVIERLKRCRELLADCSWNGRRLDCCSAFKRLPTKRGACYSINSEMTGSRFKLEVSHYSKQGELKFSATKDIQVYLHDPKDVWPEDAAALLAADGQEVEALYRTVDSQTEDSVRLTSQAARGCLLSDESPQFPIYSHSLCRLRCLARAQARRCRCVHHLLPTLVNAPDCDLDGLMCLDKHLSPKKENKVLRKCKCLPSCDESNIHIVWYNILRKNTTKRSVSLVLTNPPTEKIFLRGRYDLLDFFALFATITRLFTETTILDLLRVIFFKKRTNTIVNQSILYKNVLY